MSYRIFSMKSGHHDSDAEEFYEAARMAKDGVATMMELANEMEHKYGERFYGDRYGYGHRDHGEWDETYGERRRRDSRGRYM